MIKLATLKIGILGEAVRLIDDMFFSSLNQDNGYLVAADFEKAFDSVDHDFFIQSFGTFWFWNIYLLLGKNIIHRYKQLCHERGPFDRVF